MQPIAYLAFAGSCRENVATSSEREGERQGQREGERRRETLDSKTDSKSRTQLAAARLGIRDLRPCSYVLQFDLVLLKSIVTEVCENLVRTIVLTSNRTNGDASMVWRSRKHRRRCMAPPMGAAEDGEPRCFLGDGDPG